MGRAVTGMRVLGMAANGRADRRRGAARLRRAASVAVAAAMTAWGVLAMAGVAAASWGYQGTPPVPGATTWGFSAVSCWSGTACMAVGSQSNPSGGLLAESRNGTAWAIRAIPDPGGGSLDAISCSWSVQAPVPAGAIATGLDTVS